MGVCSCVPFPGIPIFCLTKIACLFLCFFPWNSTIAPRKYVLCFCLFVFFPRIIILLPTIISLCVCVCVSFYLMMSFILPKNNLCAFGFFLLGYIEYQFCAWPGCFWLCFMCVSLWNKYFAPDQNVFVCFFGCVSGVYIIQGLFNFFLFHELYDQPHIESPKQKICACTVWSLLYRISRIMF